MTFGDEKWELIKQSQLLKIKSQILSNLFNEKYGLRLGEFKHTNGTERVKTQIIVSFAALWTLAEAPSYCMSCGKSHYCRDLNDCRTVWPTCSHCTCCPQRGGMRFTVWYHLLCILYSIYVMLYMAFWKWRLNLVFYKTLIMLFLPNIWNNLCIYDSC